MSGEIMTWSKLLSTVFVFWVCLSGTTARADVIIVGNDAVPRSLASGDTAVSPFIMVLNEDVFPSGTIVQWDTHIVNVLGDEKLGTMGLLVLTPGQEAGSYTVAARDIRTSLQVGENTFQSTSIPVNANDVLALYMSTARVSLDFSGNDPTGSISYFLNMRDPQLGDILQLPNGRSTRTYSINATVVIDDPTS